MALGLFNNYAEIGERAFTKWRALATDLFVQDSWKPTSNLTIEGGVRWAHLAAVVFDDQQHRELRSAVLRSPPNAAGRQSVDGPDRRRRSLQRHRPAGRRVRRRRQRSGVVAQDPQCSGALPRRAPRVLRYPLQRVRAAPGRVVRDQREDDRPRQRRRLPQPRDAQRLVAARRQPAVPADGDRRQRQRRTIPGGARRSRSTCPFGMQGQEIAFKHPTAYMWSAGVQREMPFGFVVDATYVGRRGLYNCSASATSTSCCRARSRRTRASTSRRSGPTRATARFVSPRTPAARCTTACSSARTSATGTASRSASPTRSASPRTTPATSATSSGTPTTTPTSGVRRASTARTC